MDGQERKKVTCLVTIHGIGFQQAPENGAPGYADGLHERLHNYLGASLGDDPGRERSRPGEDGPVYVQSHWPPDSDNIEAGLKRLGTWSGKDHREIDIAGAPLVEGTAPIAHVALVYSHLQDQGPHLGAIAETSAKAILCHSHYASIASLVRTGIVDVMAILRHPSPQPGTATPSLQVRRDASKNAKPSNAPQDPSGPFAVVDQLDHDITTYVCRNDLRERVRGFVHEALLRLACRPDVENIVVNAHSQGTVLSFDVLRTLPPFAAEKVACYVTAGSPLRKYADIFYWGQDAGCIYQMKWRNFWDKVDPVADPLAPSQDWGPGDPTPEGTGYSELFRSIDPNTGSSLQVSLVDALTDNAAHGAGGGLPAHNYWDNNDQFVRPLAELLHEASGAGAPHVATTMAPAL